MNIIDILLIAISILLSVCFLLFMTKQKATKKNTLLETNIAELEKDVSSKNNEIEQLLSDRSRLIKYEAIIDVEAAVAEMRSNADKYVAEATQKSYDILNSSKESMEQAVAKLEQLKNDYKDGLETYIRLRKEMAIYEEKIDMIEHGVYEPVYSFDFSSQYLIELYGVREKQKEMIRKDNAAICNTAWSLSGSEAKGRSLVQKQKKLMLRAFNGECDYLISKVKWNNINQVRDRLLIQYESINKLGETNDILIDKEYKQLKLDELFLEYEYQVKKKEEKEAQRLAQEQIREEEKARREYEQAQKEAEKEADIYQTALDKAKEEILQAAGEEQTKLQLKIQLLEAELQATIQKRQRAQSMAEQTKLGHVYIISNIGSFGENIYKIGMTRRLEPMDRVRELGDASVPFKFDVHAMIFSDDAPKLESELHRLFDTKKVNMVNNRKEFFKVSIDDIEMAAKNIGVNVEFVKIPEAEEYRETLAILEKNNNPEKTVSIEEQIASKFPETI
jgi:hypothetical protein